MTWLSDEQGIETSRPREAIEIRYGTTTHRIATGSREASFALFGSSSAGAFVPQSAERDAVSSVPLSSPESRSSDADAVNLRLLAAHPFSQRYLQGKLPRDITLTIYRQQAGGDVEQLWTGRIVSAKASGHVVTYTATARTSADLHAKRLPLVVSRRCPLVLYGNGCNQTRTGFTVSTTVLLPGTIIAPTAITVASIGGKPDDWARHGELLHVPSGERYPIIAQVGTSITLDESIYGLAIGDAVLIYAGCDRLVETCETKFGNRQNFGGEPELPLGDRFRPDGYDVAAKDG